MTLEDLAFPPRAADILNITASMIRASAPEEKPEVHARNILSLDLGTHTGWAVRRRSGAISYGTDEFPDHKAAPGQRWVDFRYWLAQKMNDEQIHLLIYENVVFTHSSSQASNVYGGFLALAQMGARTRNIPFRAVAVPTVKKHWTGSGRAKKPDMIAEARRRGFRPDTDNAADALAILHWAIAREEA